MSLTLLAPVTEHLPDPIAITPPRLAIGDRIERSGVTYEFTGKATNAKGERGKSFVRLDTRATVWIGNAELLELMVSREVTMAIPSWLPQQRHAVWRQDFHSRPEHEKRLPRMREEYVKAFLENRRLGYPRKVADVQEAVYRKRLADPAVAAAGETMASLAAIYGWMEIEEKAEGPRGIKRFCFAEGASGRRGVQVPAAIKPHVMDAIRELWFTPQRHRVRSIFDRVIASCSKHGVPEEDWVSLRTVRRLLDALPPYAAMRARKGARAADLKHRSVGQMEEAVLPGQVYEVDAHKLDFLGVDSRMRLPLGRLWVTVVIDRCTRMIVGFHLHVEPPSSLTIAAALRNAFAPKLYMRTRWPDVRTNVAWGLPELLILDNGLENHATFLLEALEELGVAWLFAKPRTPEDKPYIERWFGTLTRDFSSRLPGWVGSNPREKGDYDSVALACLRIEDADELLHRWVANYNVDVHEGVTDVPEAKWLRLVEDLEVAPIEDMGILDVLLGDYALRTPGVRGIFLLGIRFGDLGDNRPLELIRTRAGGAGVTKVRVRFDRNDLSRIWVQDPVSKEYIWVASLDPSYTTGLTLAQHRIIRRHALERCRGYLTVAELCTARDDLQRRIDAMTGAEPMTERRFAQMFNGLGSKGSWADFYRMMEAEYGTGRADDARCTVLDLLESDEDGLVPAPVPAPIPTLAPPSAPSAAPMTESLAARAGRLGVKVTGVALPVDVAVAPVDPVPVPAVQAVGASLAERLAARGMKTGASNGR